MARNPYLPRRDFGWLAVLALVLLGLIAGGLVGAVYLRPGPDPRAGAVAKAEMDRASVAADQRRVDARKADAADGPVAGPVPPATVGPEAIPPATTPAPPPAR